MFFNKICKFILFLFLLFCIVNIVILAKKKKTEIHMSVHVFNVNVAKNEANTHSGDSLVVQLIS